MPEQLRKFVILMIAIAVVLVIILLLGSSKSGIRRLMIRFMTDDGGRYKESSEPRKKPKKEPKYKASQPRIEMATLIRKSDDRRRVIESTGQTRIEDELYELFFKNRMGKTVIIECSKEAYEKIPFNQQGSLTYKRNTLVKFKYFGGIVYNDGRTE